MEDNFSTNGGRGGNGSGGNASDGERQMKLPRSPATYLLLCGLVPNTLWTGTDLRPKGWGPLPQRVPPKANTEVREENIRTSLLSFTNF